MLKVSTKDWTRKSTSKLGDLLTRRDSLIDTRQRDRGLFAVKQYLGSYCSVLAYGRPCHSELSSFPGVSDFHMGEAIGNESPKPLYGAKIPR